MDDVVVIIPAYNAGTLLARAIKSVLAQTCAIKDIVVIDDGSTDYTLSIARSYSRGVRCVSQSNAGVSAARNRGLRESDSKWIAFLDADDEWLPEKTERQVSILQAHGELRWCACNPEMVSAGRHWAGRVPSDLREALKRDLRMAYFSSVLRGVSVQTSGVMIHRSVFERVGDFDPELAVCQDRDLWWRIAMKYPMIGYCPDVCYRFYLDSPGSLTKGPASRDAELGNICTNMRRASAAGAQVAEAFHPYARKLASDYLLRAAGGRAVIDSRITSEARELFPPTLRERIIRSCLAGLPASLAGKIVDRLSL